MLIDERNKATAKWWKGVQATNFRGIGGVRSTSRVHMITADINMCGLSLIRAAAISACNGTGSPASSLRNTSVFPDDVWGRAGCQAGDAPTRPALDGIKAVLVHSLKHAEAMRGSSAWLQALACSQVVMPHELVELLFGSVQDASDGMAAELTHLDFHLASSANLKNRDVRSPVVTTLEEHVVLR